MGWGERENINWVKKENPTTNGGDFQKKKRTSLSKGEGGPGGPELEGNTPSVRGQTQSQHGERNISRFPIGAEGEETS